MQKLFSLQSRLILQPSRITYDSEQLIAAAVWQEVAHGVPFRGRSYRLGARLICLRGKKNEVRSKEIKITCWKKSSAPHIIIHFKIIGT